MSISLIGESSNYQCGSAESSHVPRKHKSQFIAASVSSAGSYSIATSEEGKCFIWGLVPWAEKTFSNPLVLDIQESVHAQAANQFAAVITRNGSVLRIEKQTNIASLESVAATFPKTNKDTRKILCSVGLGGKFLSSVAFSPSQGHVIQIACGLEHAVILTSSGKLFGWGSNQCRQLDPSSSTEAVWLACRSIPTPSDVDGDMAESSAITQISCRGWATAVLFQQGGFAMTGALSLYGIVERAEWILFSLVDEGAPMGMITVGLTFVLTTTSSGALYSFGRGPMGELGQGAAISICTEPTIISVMKGRITTFIACGDHHAAAICEDSGDSALFLWGRNLSGECAVHPGSGPITTPRLVSEFSARSGLIPLKVTCGTNFTVVVHSNPHESTSSELENTNFHGPPQTAELESSTEASTSVWFKKLQTVDGFLDEQLQASALCDSTIASAQLETSASLKSNLFLGRSIESRQFVPFPEATVAGVLESQIAQSPYLTQDEKRMALTQQNSCTGNETKTALSRAIRVSNISINGVEVRSNAVLLLKIRALCDDGTEIFVKKAAPTPLNEELCATIQTEFIIPVLHRDEITLQFQIKHKDFTGISMSIGECSKAFKFVDWFQSSAEGCQLLSPVEPVTLNMSIFLKSGGSASKGNVKANFQSVEDTSTSTRVPFS